jgi:hypothetical protein
MTMINIARLKFLTFDARTRAKMKAEEQEKKDLAAAQKLMDRNIGELAEKAANDGYNDVAIYTLEVINHTGYGNRPEHLTGVAKHLFRLCAEAGLKPEIRGNGHYIGQTPQIFISWSDE